MTEYERGFEQGKQSVQPHWISVEERLPERKKGCRRETVIILP